MISSPPDKVYILPVFDTITTAWNKMSGSKATIWGAFLFSFVIMIGVVIFISLFSVFFPFLKPVIGLVANVISILLFSGVIYIAIQHVSNNPINFSMLFVTFNSPLILNILAVAILRILIFLIPSLIIMGSISMAYLPIPLSGLLGFIIFCAALVILFILYYRLAPVFGFVLDQNLGPIEAIKAAFQATRYNVLCLLGIHLLAIAIFIISLIPFGIGLIWTIPFLFNLYAVIYKRLLFNVENQVTAKLAEPSS